MHVDRKIFKLKIIGGDPHPLSLPCNGPTLAISVCITAFIMDSLPYESLDETYKYLRCENVGSFKWYLWKILRYR